MTEEPGKPQPPAPPQAANDPRREKIRGVFSSQAIQRVGTGTTTRRIIQKTYWMVEENTPGVIEVQPLNTNYVPSGPKRQVSMEELLEQFAPEPEFYITTVYPKLRELDATIVKGEQHRSRGEIFSAELEFSSALAVDEENVRANFGLGLTYLDRGESNKANDIFERLVRLEAAFEKQHKHLFNEFGINLRKNKMYEQALEYYQRAEDLSPHDDNLFFNVGRAYFEKGQYANCAAYLHKALELNPDFSEAKQFLEFMTTRELLGKDQATVVPGERRPAPKPKAAPAEDEETPDG